MPSRLDERSEKGLQLPTELDWNNLVGIFCRRFHSRPQLVLRVDLGAQAAQAVEFFFGCSHYWGRSSECRIPPCAR
jgi:hypothetical protein